MNEFLIISRREPQKTLLLKQNLAADLADPRVIMMWIPSIINADMNFDLRGIPITPEKQLFHSFSFMGMVCL